MLICWPGLEPRAWSTDPFICPGVWLRRAALRLSAPGGKCAALLTAATRLAGPRHARTRLSLAPFVFLPGFSPHELCIFHLMEAVNLLARMAVCKHSRELCQMGGPGTEPQYPVPIPGPNTRSPY